MKLLAFVLVSVALAATGCSGSTGAETASAPPSKAEEEAATPRSDIYAAVIRRFVEGHTEAGLGSLFARIFVVDGVVEKAGDPFYQFDETREPFSTAVKRRISRALADLPPLAFVTDEEGLIGGDGECDRNRDGGVLIGLSPISEPDGSATISNTVFGCVDRHVVIVPILLS